MGVIFGEPGKIICIKPRHSFNPFARIPGYRILKPQQHFSYFGKEPEIITISDFPLNVELKEKKIKTADNAVIDVGVELTAKPKIDNINREQIFKTIQAFEKIDKKINEKRDEELKKWLKNILAPITNWLEVFLLEDIYGDNSQINKDQNEAITFKIEKWANDLIAEYNFVVVKRSCRLILPEIQNWGALKDDNPNHQPMLAYINKHSNISEGLKKDRRKHEKDLEESKKKHEEALKILEKEHEEALKILEDKYVEKNRKLQRDSKEAELRHKKYMEEKEKEIEADIDKIKKNHAINKELIESESSIIINAINAEIHEKQNEFELKKIRNDSKKEKEKQIVEMNFKNEVEQEELRLIIEGIKNESQYSGILNSQQVSIKEMLNKNELKFKKELCKLEKEINEIKSEEDYEKDLKQINLKTKPEKLRHQYQMEQKSLNALALIVSYAIQAEEKHRMVDNLGDSIPKMMEALKGMITDLKIVNMPNGENGKSMFGDIKEIYNNFMTASSMFAPLLSDLMQEFRRSGFSQEEEDSGDSDRDF